MLYPLAYDVLRQHISGTIYILRCALLFLLFAFTGVGVAAATETIHISDTAGLMAAMRGMKGGETILLAPGEYEAIQLLGKRMPLAFSPAVTLASENAQRPAILTGLDVRDAQGLVFDGLIFDYRFALGQKIYTRPFSFSQSQNITIRNSVFDGDVAQGVSPEEDGLGWGFGLEFRGGERITIENNEIRRFFRGLVTGGITELTVRGNNIHSLRMDGMNFSSVQRVLIEGNQIHSFRRSALKQDHADMIQFWTNGTTKPSTDIVIRANLLMSGEGGQTQSIFMRNDMVDRGLAGPELFYRNVTIEENLIVNGHVHGITLGESDGVVIRHNTLLRNHRVANGNQRDRRVLIPRINLAEGSKNVVIENNIGPAFPAERPGWRVRGNLVAQDRTAMAEGFYHKLFEAAQTGDPTAVDSYAIRPGSQAHRLSLGAPILHQTPTGLRLFATEEKN